GTRAADGTSPRVPHEQTADQAAASGIAQPPACRPGRRLPLDQRVALAKRSRPRQLSVRDPGRPGLRGSRASDPSLTWRYPPRHGSPPVVVVGAIDPPPLRSCVQPLRVATGSVGLPTIWSAHCSPASPPSSPAPPPWSPPCSPRRQLEPLSPSPPRRSPARRQRVVSRPCSEPTR